MSTYTHLMTETGFGSIFAFVMISLAVVVAISINRAQGETMPVWAGRYAKRMTRLTLDVYGSRCHLCEKPGATTADHLVPRSLGGSDAIENLRPAHKLCNSRRGNRSIDWFRARYAPHLLHPEQPAEQWSFFN